MKTIERATEYANSICDRYEWGVENKEWKLAYQQYVDIVTDQKAIDIEKAKEWIMNQFPDTYTYDDIPIEDAFVKFMEEEK